MRIPSSSSVVNFLVAATVIACVRSTDRSFEIEKKNETCNKQLSCICIDQEDSQRQCLNIITKIGGYCKYGSQLSIENCFLRIEIDEQQCTRYFYKNISKQGYNNILTCKPEQILLSSTNNQLGCYYFYENETQVNFEILSEILQIPQNIINYLFIQLNTQYPRLPICICQEIVNKNNFYGEQYHEMNGKYYQKCQNNEETLVAEVLDGYQISESNDQFDDVDLSQKYMFQDIYTQNGDLLNKQSRQTGDSHQQGLLNISNQGIQEKIILPPSALKTILSIALIFLNLKENIVFLLEECQFISVETLCLIF